jgi:outer membrane protein OmpA-like peptidoglycan-associated protein
MRYILFLAAAAVLVAACSAPDPIAFAPDQASGPAGRVEVQDKHALRITPGGAAWTPYREFYFDSTSADVSISDRPKLNEIVAYLNGNPSLDVGIDGTPAAEGAGEADRNLSDRRAASVRIALMSEGGGVASYKIFTGAFAASNRRHAGQIQVLVGPRTGSSKAALPGAE